MTTSLNRRTTLQLILTASLIANFACVDQGGGSSSALGTPTEDDKIFYSIGMMAGSGIAEFELTEEEFEWVARGVADSALGRELLANPEDHMPQIQEIFAARKAQANAAEATASAEFLEQEVKVHYHGTLRDGTVFDSSVDRGSPAQFPLDRVIPCWTEAVTQMKVGTKSRIVCPAAIAYGSRGMGTIPGDAALVFEVELLEIVE